MSLIRVCTLCAAVGLVGSTAWPTMANEAIESAPGDAIAAEHMPADVPVVLVVRDGGALAQTIKDRLDAWDYPSSPTFEAVRTNPGLAQMRVMFLGLAAAAGVDTWTAVGDLLGDRFALGLAPGEGDQPGFLAVGAGGDRAVRDRIVEQFLLLTGLKSAGTPDSTRSALVAGHRVYAMEDNFLLCPLPDALIVSNDENLIRSAVALDAANSLARSESFTTALGSVPEDATMWAMLNTQQVRTMIGPDGLPDRLTNPLGGFLFGGMWKQMLSGERVVAWAGADQDAVHIHALVRSSTPLPEPYRGFEPTFERGAWSGQDVDGFIGEMSIARRWEDLFAEREAILDVAAASQAANFTNTITSLLGQLDFVEDVLPAVSGPITLVLSRQNFADLGFDPTPKLPAFGLVAPVDLGVAPRLAQRLRSGALAAMSVITIDMGQQGKPTYLLNMEQYRDQQVLVTTYPPPEGADDAQMEQMAAPMASVQYNFAPAFAVLDKHVVIATSREMIHSLIDQIQDAPDAERPMGRSGDQMQIDASAVAAILRDNRQEMIAKSMLEKDNSRVAAESEIDTFIGLLSLVDGLSVSAQPGESGYEASATIRWNQPEPGAQDK